MKLLHLAYLGSCMGSRVMVAPPTKEEIAAKTAISSTELKDLMNEGKIVKKWVFHHETGLSWGQAAEECRRSGGVLGLVSIFLILFFVNKLIDIFVVKPEKLISMMHMIISRL